MNELWTEQGNNFRMNISGTEYEVSTHFDISGRQSLFAGLLYCPDGGAKLHFCASKSLKPNQEFYRCANYNSGRETCKIHYTCNCGAGENCSGSSQQSGGLCALL